MSHAVALAGPNSPMGPNEPVAPPGRWSSLALTVGIHLVLAVFLFYGVRWQSKPIEAVRVELIRAMPAPEPAVPPPSTPEPQVEPEPAPTPPPKLVESPSPKAKPSPLPPAPAPVKPDIVQKEKPKKKPEPAPKEEPAHPNRMAERLAADEKRLSNLKRNEALDRELNAARDAQQSAARGKAINEWIDRIRGKIRGNIVLPPDIRDNPEAIFEATQLPTGEVISIKLRQSSGHPALDSAIERAILKSSPLPKPPSPDVFERVLNIPYRPREN